MAGDTVITIIGNLTADPEMRFTPSGAAVASFTIASTPRSFDRQAQEWRDGETLFMRCSIWRDAAENVAESLTKGTRVIAQGRLVQRSFTTREGENRTVVEMQVDEIGPSLRYAKAQVTRQPRGGGQGGFNQGGQGGGYNAGQQQGGYQGGGQQGGYNAGPQGSQGGYSQGGQQGSYNAPAGGAPDDPWATGGTTSFGDEPPF
ncbi:single-stranded DNA-binding protein [Actinomyces ruminicola]|uniref:Single-stranded DNA-binding protein n=1 Tax=Actinomyces ruminicola TaxID=332524 RepID=A0A1H0ARN0_9ACTO|nr:single-stranded DNA-binding protein [Actinomyces ruminicola]SDM31845.1 single-strand binding protein [Actinomyces ruminicola]SDN36160.1 single-strand binding protein [Actinomyces ruminicola]